MARSTLVAALGRATYGQIGNVSVYGNSLGHNTMEVLKAWQIKSYRFQTGNKEASSTKDQSDTHDIWHPSMQAILLKVKIIMYPVSAQGVNLDKACSRVLVATAAINAPLEV